VKTPTLFDVPEDHPSREQRIAAVKKELGIYTFHSKHMDKSNEPWTAILKESVDETDDAMWERVGRYCVRMEDEGTMVYGRTEREAIERLPKEISRERGATENKMSTPQSSHSPTPKLPFDPSVPQPTPIEKETIEGRWNDQTIQQRLEMLKTDAKNHPEFVASLAKQIADVLASKIVELMIK
jgi:hypothetical protein